MAGIFGDADLPAYVDSIQHWRTGLLTLPTTEKFHDAMRQFVIDHNLHRSLQVVASKTLDAMLSHETSLEPRLDSLRALTNESPRVASLGTRLLTQYKALRARVERCDLSEAFIHGSGIEVGTARTCRWQQALKSNMSIGWVKRISTSIIPN